MELEDDWGAALVKQEKEVAEKVTLNVLDCG